MESKNNIKIHPRDVADKSVKQNLFDAIKMSLEIESESVKRNTGVFNSNRYLATAKLDDYQELKDKAREIKEQSISVLPELIELTKKTIEYRGGKVFLAKNSQEANNYIRTICKNKNAKLIVKAKSITTEEIGLNKVLEKDGIEVAETDLAEFILQISKEQPSHNVAPAIHQSRERIAELFKNHFKTDLPLETGEELTKFARDILREKFLSADIGISGANLIAADTGSILLVESEGNIRLTTHLPATHIAVAGIEKIIRNFNNLPVFIELLAASGTGQSLTSYTNIITPPIRAPILNLNERTDTERDFHLVLIDNGRMLMRDDPVFHEALYCIRCSACMNVCANFQSVGGHAFGGECYTGGIGGAWAAGTTGEIKNARFAELCTGCSRCVPNCPVKINIPRLNTEIKSRLIEEEGVSFQKKFFGNFSKLAMVSANAPQVSNFLNSLPVSRLIFDKTIGFKKNRPMPKFSLQTLEKQYKEYIKENKQDSNSQSKVILFADVFTNYNNAHVGMSVVEVFNKFGINVLLSKSIDDGRAFLSQGMVKQAKDCAFSAATKLEMLIDKGFDIIVVEPSVLTMFRYEYEKLLPENGIFQKIKSRCYDTFEYLNLIFDNDLGNMLTLKPEFNGDIIYHGHCQLKSIGLGKEVAKFFKKLGITIEETTAECCGMAGSFGYKKEYYNLSKKVGEFLGNEIKESNAQTILASGTSCREQISDEINRKVLHPIEFLVKILTDT